jgi:pilus assembly protein CpaE
MLGLSDWPGKFQRKLEGCAHSPVAGAARQRRKPLAELGKQCMYPLKIITVNCGEALLTQLRAELDAYQAGIECEFNTVDQAIEKWSWSDSEPHLVLFPFRGLSDVHELKCLKRAFDWPVLALVDAPRDQLATLLVLANRAGAAQLVPMPLDSEDFRSALDTLGLEHGFGGGNAKIVAVSGMTGGCGATTVAINLANEIAYLYKRRTILVELALQKGMLATYLNVEPKYTLPDLLSPNVKLDLSVVQQAFIHIAENFDIVSGSHFEITPVEASHLDVLRLLDHFRRLSEVVVLDVPCTNDEAYVQKLSAADHVVLVAEQNLPSLRSLRLVLEMLAKLDLKGGARREMQLEVVLNRYDPKSREFELAQLKEKMGLPEMMTVANDYAAIKAALNSGVPLRMEVPRSRVLADIDELAKKVIGPGDLPADGTPRAKGSWFGKLARVFAGTGA